MALYVAQSLAGRTPETMRRRNLPDIYRTALAVAGYAALITLGAAMMLLAGHQLYDSPSEQPLPTLLFVVCCGPLVFLGAVLVVI
jgi:hypothetical protein